MVLKQQRQQWQRSQICANNFDLLKLPHKKDSDNDNEDNNNKNSNEEDNNNEDN